MIAIGIVIALVIWHVISWVLALLITEDGDDVAGVQFGIAAAPFALAAVGMAYVRQWAIRGLHYSSCGLFPDAHDDPMEYFL